MAAGGVSADVRAEIERRALAIAAALAARDGPYYAEIAEGEAPAWRLVRVAPRAEERAMRFLAARRFGVYLPMFRRRWTRPHRGAAAAGVAETPMFPGYLLLDVWGAERHLRRINACPGVVGLVCRDERPVIVPDAVVADLQRIELATDPVVAAELAMRRGRGGRACGRRHHAALVPARRARPVGGGAGGRAAAGARTGGGRVMMDHVLDDSEEELVRLWRRAKRYLDALSLSDGEQDECWHCGGEGWTHDCIDGFCEDAEDGCELCMRRCVECARRVRDEARADRVAILRTIDVELAVGWAVITGRWREGLTRRDVLRELHSARAGCDAFTADERAASACWVEGLM
jgi:transcription antitermination factor NusG